MRVRRQVNLMGFIVILLFSFCAGLLGGMGMGGGTILIPALTIFMGVEQHVAQAANLLAFLPMALLSLKIHSGNGLINARGAVWIIIPAVVLSVGGAFLAAYTPSDILRRMFGAFLIALAVKQAYDNYAAFAARRDKKGGGSGG